MTKADLVKKVASNLPVQQAIVENVYEEICKISAQALINGDEIFLQGIGKLKVKNVAARKGCNPRTHEEILIPAKKKVVLCVSAKIKEALNK